MGNKHKIIIGLSMATLVIGIVSLIVGRNTYPYPYVSIVCIIAALISLAIGYMVKVFEEKKTEELLIEEVSVEKEDEQTKES